MQLRREGNRETEGNVELLCGHSCHLRVETGLAFSAVNSGEISINLGTRTVVTFELGNKYPRKCQVIKSSTYRQRYHRLGQ